MNGLNDKKVTRKKSMIVSCKTRKKSNCKKGIKIIIENNNMNIMNTMNTMNHIEKFKTNGIKILEQLHEDQLNKMLLEAKKAYYNENPILTDNQYDILEDYMKQTYPKNKIVEKIGASPIEKNKVKLPFEMWSMDKIKPDTNALSNWKSK
jgi:hypothetical protein